MHIWEIPYTRQHYDEDNDTSDESSSEEEEKQDPKMMALLNSLMSSEQSQKAYKQMVKKGGLSYFLDEERKFLKKLTKPGAKEPANEVMVDRNEFQGKDGKAFEPLEAGDSGSDETDEEFEWYQSEKHDGENWFVFLNHQRRTLMPGE